MKFKPEFLTRQSTLIPSELLSQKITIIGAGAIGSHTAIMLARMGISNIEVWDFDVVGEENMNNQGYDISDINIPKVIALTGKIKRAIGFDISPCFKKYEGGDLKGIVIAAVDSMATRKLISENLEMADFVIDPRMAAEHASLYVYPADSEVYPKSLFPDRDVPFVPCTEKSTIYCASLISGLVVKAVKDIITGGNFTKHVEWNLKTNKYQSWLNKVEEL